MIGRYETYYHSGNKASELELKNGKIQGEGKVYYENGKLYMIVEYENNMMKTIKKMYSIDGKEISLK